MTTPDRDSKTPLTREDVPAIDALGRSRQVSMYSRNDGVVLQVPPGEAAVLHPDHARALADQLYKQAEVRPHPSSTVVPLRRKSRPSRSRTGSGNEESGRRVESPDPPNRFRAPAASSPRGPEPDTAASLNSSLR